MLKLYPLVEFFCCKFAGISVKIFKTKFGQIFYHFGNTDIHKTVITKTWRGYVVGTLDMGICALFLRFGLNSFKSWCQETSRTRGLGTSGLGTSVTYKN